MKNEHLDIHGKLELGDIVVPLKDATERQGGYTEAYPTGFLELDTAMKVGDEERGGFRDGDLVIVTGISGAGKTTFTQNITMSCDKEALPVMWFSFEVVNDNLWAKFKAMGANDDSLIYSPKKNITGKLSWVKEKIKEAQEKYFAKFVMIDHLDFLSPSDKENTDQYRMVLRNICQELKTMAIEQKCIIVLMAHTKKVQGREVEMQDIGESAGVYQMADYVIAVSRYHDVVDDPDSHGQTIRVATDEGMVKVLKNRLTGNQPYFNFEMENNIIKPKYD